MSSAKRGPNWLNGIVTEPRLQAAAGAAREAIAYFTTAAKQRDEIAQHTDAELNALQRELTNEQHQLKSIESQFQSRLR